MKKQSNIVKIFCTTCAITFLGNAMINSIFILMMSKVKGYSIHQMAMVTSLTPILVIPAAFVWGKLIDRYKKLILWAEVIVISQGILTLTLAFVEDFRWFFAINLIRIMLTQPIGSVHDEYIMDLSKTYQVPFGRMRLFGTIGFGLSGVASPFIVRHFGIKAAILTGVVIVILNVLMYSRLPNKVSEDDAVKEFPKTSKLNLDLFKNIPYLKFILVSSLLFGTLTSASGFSTQIILMELHCPNEIIAAMPILMVIFEALLLGIVHKFRVARKPYMLFLLALIFISLRWIILAHASSYLVVVITTLVHGIICGITLGAQTRIVGDLVQPKDRSSALLIQGTISFTLAPGIINLFTSSLMPKLGISVFGYTYFILSVVGVIILLPDILGKKVSVPSTL